MLSSRKQDILKAVIQEYIKTANPVGSRTISRSSDLSLSAATIRNEMSDLEEEGFLNHPHTSAGRVPTVHGYRFFVDYLLKMKRLTEEERIRLKQTLEDVKNKQHQVRALIKQANRLLASMSRYTSLIIAPHIKSTRLKNIQLVSIDSRHVLVVLVTESGLVEDHVITVNEEINQDSLNEISTLLKARMMGLSLNEIKKAVEEEFSEEFNHIKRYDALLIQSLDVLQNSLALTNSDSEVQIAGMSHILRQPEFRDIDNIKPIMEFLEKKQVLSDILAEGIDFSDIRVLIGEEERRNPGYLTFITAPYRMGARPVGTVALVGPTRMEYGRAMVLVKEMAQILGNVLTEYDEE